MKKLVLLFSMLVVGLAGCAHPGYQRSYVGYSSGYSGGYGAYRYSDYPSRTYYQPGGVIRYQQYYAPAYPSHHHGHDHDHGHERYGRRDWDGPAKQYRSERWKPNMPYRSWQERSDRPGQAWTSEARKRKSMIESRRFPGFERRAGEDGRGGVSRSQRRMESGMDFRRENRDRQRRNRD